jgi:hypothetical protein
MEESKDEKVENLSETELIAGNIGCSLRGEVWKLLIRLPTYDYELYEKLQVPSDDSFTIVADVKRTFSENVEFNSYLPKPKVFRLANAFSVLRGGANGIGYVQGMNAFMAALLSNMTEIDAFFTFDRVIIGLIPTYFQPGEETKSLSDIRVSCIGHIAGRVILYKILKLVDLQLYNHFFNNQFVPKDWTPRCKCFEIHVLDFSSLMGAIQPFDEAMNVMDFLFAFGYHLLPVVIAACVVSQRKQCLGLMDHDTLINGVRFEIKDARKVVDLTCRFIRELPSDIHLLLETHTHDRNVVDKLILEEIALVKEMSDSFNLVERKKDL